MKERFDDVADRGPLGAILGRMFGMQRWVLVSVAGVWYTCLAVQTAHLAHPGREGFFGIDALPAVQGAGFGQYWLSQPVIAGLMVAALVGCARLRDSRLRPGTGRAGRG